MLIVLFLFSTVLLARQDEQPSQPELPPAVKLGLRVAGMERRLRVVPDLVLVDDEAQYIEAIARWRMPVCFPVLIDDGSFEAREQIGRFARGFRPRNVVRWRTDEALMPIRAKVPRFVEWAMARAWGLGDDKSEQTHLLAKWNERGFVPPGVVIADVDDRSWTAALALGAARGQPVIWIDAPTGIDTALGASNAAKLSIELRERTAEFGYSWSRLGDDIDAVTLCFDAPVKVRIDKNKQEHVALTDYLGRLEGPKLPGPRWAWVGQVHGGGRDAAYRAMCALFLDTNKAWVFDGYGPGEPWELYDGTAAAANLRESGFETTLFDYPNQGAQHWRVAVSHGIDAGLVIVNSSGMHDWFDLRPGRARSGDVPLLEQPAAVNFVHSWSATAPGRPNTIAARWLEHGAYAYVGSVQEPYLQAFVPTPVMATRLTMAATWASAVRFENSDPWRIAVLGDPLLIFGPPLTRVDQELPLEGAQPVLAQMRAAVRAKDFAAAAEMLVLLGRDEDASRLADAVIRDENTSVTPEFAAAAQMSLFRTGRRTAMLDVYKELIPDDSRNLMRQDSLWQMTTPMLGATRDSSMLTLLRRNLREGQEQHDAGLLAPAFARLFGSQAAASMFKQVRKTLRTDKAKREMDAVIKKFKSRKP